MKNKLYQLGVGVLLPVLAGCNGGGGSASSFSTVGSLFAGADSSTGGTTTLASLSTFSTLSTISGFSSLTSSALTNPEPASLLLVGGGLITIGYLKGLKKKLR